MKVILSGSINPPEFVVMVVDEKNENNVLHSGTMAITKDTTKASLDVFEEQILNEYKTHEAKIEAELDAKNLVEGVATTLFNLIGLGDDGKLEKPYPGKEEAAPVEAMAAATVTP